MAARPPQQDAFSYQIYHAEGVDAKAFLEWKLVQTDSTDELLQIPRELRDTWIFMYESGNVESVFQEVYAYIPEDALTLKNRVGGWISQMNEQNVQFQGAVLPRQDRTARSHQRNLLELITDPANQEVGTVPEIQEAALGRQIQEYLRQELAAGLNDRIFDILKQYLDDIATEMFVEVVILFRDFRTMQYEQSLKSSQVLDLDAWESELKESLRKIIGNLPEKGRDIRPAFPELADAADVQNESPGSPLAWVCIKGTTDSRKFEANPDLKQIAYAVGRKLAETDFGLLISTYRGVNAAAMTAFIQSRDQSKKQLRGYVKILAESDVPVLLQGNPDLDGKVESEDLVQPGEADDVADTCILVGMTGPLQNNMRSFLEKGKPVFPVYDSFSDEITDMIRRTIQPYAKSVYGNEVVLQTLEGHYKDAIDRILDVLRTSFPRIRET